jgi:uncharacterized protein (DUF2345 family)
VVSSPAGIALTTPAPTTSPAAATWP